MKCKYCHADIERGAQFCTSCGKDLSLFDKCVNCGELLEKDTRHCPYCGTEQPHKEVAEPKGSKKWIWAVACILLLCAIGGGFYFFKGNSFNKPQTVETDTAGKVEDTNAKNDIHSVDDIKARLAEILSAVAVPSVELEVMGNYFTKQFTANYKREYQNAYKEGREYPRIWWQESESDPEQYTIHNIDKKSEKEAYAKVTISGAAPEGTFSADFDVVLEKENGKWLIDRITRHEYDEGSDPETASSNIDGYDRLLSDRKLTDSDLEYKSKKELEIMRNSVYARYGYRFKRDDLFDYFSQFSWYEPKTSDMTTVYNSMSIIEKYNVDFIKKHE